MADEHRVETADGASLWVAVEGTGSPVVLCHGGPGLWDYLGDLAARLSPAFTVYRWDQRACGRSTSGSAAPSMQQTLDDLESLRHHFGHARWSVVGHSYGAEVALCYALECPASVERIAYVSGRGPQHWWRSVGSQACRVRTLERMTADQAERLAVLGDVAARTADEEAELRYLSWMADFREPESSAALRAMVEAPFSINFALNRALSREQLLDAEALRVACEHLEVPTLFMHGAEDPRPAEGAALLAGWVPSSAMEIVPEAAHSPWVDQPDLVGARLVRFLRDGR